MTNTTQTHFWPMLRWFETKCESVKESVCERESVCVRVCLCVWARECVCVLRERERKCVWVCMLMFRFQYFGLKFFLYLQFTASALRERLNRNQILQPSRHKHTQDRSTRRRHMPYCAGRRRHTHWTVLHTRRGLWNIHIITQRKRNSSASVTESNPLNANAQADTINRSSQGENNTSLSDRRTNDTVTCRSETLGRGSDMML